MTALLVVAPKADPVERRAADVIRAYSDEGEHRTATAVDRASANALVARARATGATASLEPFDLSRVDTVAAFAEIDGRQIDGLPMFDGPFTGAAGVTGRIGVDRERSADCVDADRAQWRSRAAADARRIEARRDRRSHGRRKDGTVPRECGLVQRAVRPARPAAVQRAAQRDRGRSHAESRSAARHRRDPQPCPGRQRRRPGARDRSRAGARLRDDAAQRLARERVGARRRARVLAGDHASRGCGQIAEERSRSAANGAIHRVERPRARASRPARLPSPESHACAQRVRLGAFRREHRRIDRRHRHDAFRRLAARRSIARARAAGAWCDSPVAGGAGGRRGGDDQGGRRAFRVLHRPQRLVPQPARCLAGRRRSEGDRAVRPRHRRPHAGAREQQNPRLSVTSIVTQSFQPETRPHDLQFVHSLRYSLDETTRHIRSRRHRCRHADRDGHRPDKKARRRSVCGCSQTIHRRGSDDSRDAGGAEGGTRHIARDRPAVPAADRDVRGGPSRRDHREPESAGACRGARSRTGGRADSRAAARHSHRAEGQRPHDLHAHDRRRARVREPDAALRCDADQKPHRRRRHHHREDRHERAGELRRRRADADAGRLQRRRRPGLQPVRSA